MKVAVINFSGNVGKSTVARHLLLPRLHGAELVAVESVNAGDGPAQALRGREFAELQEYLQTVDQAVVDIGASSIEDFLNLMERYRGSQADFDCFVVPTVPPAKQQQDTIATLVALGRLGVPASRLKVVFNMVEPALSIEKSFPHVLAFLSETKLAAVNPACCIGSNEIYARIRGSGRDLADLASDDFDYKGMIAAASDTAEKLRLAQKLATRRLASGVVPELDACFAALGLDAIGIDNVIPMARLST